jgi:hypothetical protein
MLSPLTRIAVLGAALTLSACESVPTVVPGHSFEVQSDIALPKERVFQTMVKLMEDRGMKVVTQNVEAGRMTVETQSISPEVMDERCVFPAIDDKDQPASTFAAYHAMRIDEEKHGVLGLLDLTVDVLALGDEYSRLTLTSDWVVTNGERRVPCTSLETFETELMTEFKERLLTIGS